jgi:hypothetical protein
VGGVTGEEAPPMAVPFGDLRREREAAEPLNAHRKITGSGCTGDQAGELTLAEVGESGLTSDPLS